MCENNTAVPGLIYIVWSHNVLFKNLLLAQLECMRVFALLITFLINGFM